MSRDAARISGYAMAGSSGVNEQCFSASNVTYPSGRTRAYPRVETDQPLLESLPVEEFDFVCDQKLLPAQSKVSPARRCRGVSRAATSCLIQYSYVMLHMSGSANTCRMVQPWGIFFEERGLEVSNLLIRESRARHALGFSMGQPS
jgi:hypothetical protein